MRLGKVALAAFAAVALFGAGTAHAEEFSSNLTKSEKDDLFSLKTDDVIHPFSWLKDRQTFTLVQNFDDGTHAYWFNVPNPQTLLYNTATQVMPTGYLGAGNEPAKVASIFPTYAKSPSEAKTGLQRYGFNIPSPTYVKEQPRVGMSILGVFIESNPINFVKNKIKGLFGGSYIEAPDTKTLKTLSYMSPSDYDISNNTFEKWISLYWESTMSSMDSGQVLVSGNGFSKDGKDSAGNQWTKETILENAKADSEEITTDKDGKEKVNKVPGHSGSGAAYLKNSDAKRINDLLKEYCAENYQNVVTNIVAYGSTEVNGVSGFDQIPKRVMPYDKGTMTEDDSKNLVNDSRVVEDPTTVGPINIEIDFWKLIPAQFSSFFLSLTSGISKLTVMINGVSNLETFEKLGISPLVVWKSGFMKTLVIVAAIAYVLYILKKSRDFSKGKDGAFAVFSKLFGSLIILGLVYSFAYKPDSTYKDVKTAYSISNNFGAQVLSNNGSNASALISGGDAAEKADATYWLPYFSLWTNYNTGSNLNGKQNEINVNNKNEPERNGMNYPKVNDKNINLWSANLAESFTSGTRIKPSAYRTVDHFYAPRVKFVGEKGKVIESTKNENYSRIQTFPDIGIMIMVLVIFVGVIVKFTLVLEFLWELILFPTQLCVKVKNFSDVKQVCKKLGAAFFKNAIWDYALVMIVYASTLLSGVAALMLSLVMVYALIKFFNYIPYMGIWKPNMLASVIRFFKNTKGRGKIKFA